MSDELDRELQRLQDKLTEGALSRRSFLNRLAELGVGVGAAYVLGVRNADAFSRDIRIASTDPAFSKILSDGSPGPQNDAGVGEPQVMEAQVLPHPPPPQPRPYFRYDRHYSSYDRHNPPYMRYDRTYARYDRTYSR